MIIITKILASVVIATIINIHLHFTMVEQIFLGISIGILLKIDYLKEKE